jgi:hypothetical protein
MRLAAMSLKSLPMTWWMSLTVWKPPESEASSAKMAAV